jgi:hypothetical protein
MLKTDPTWMVQQAITSRYDLKSQQKPETEVLAARQETSNANSSIFSELRQRGVTVEAAKPVMAKVLDTVAAQPKNVVSLFKPEAPQPFAGLLNLSA